MPRLFGTDGVRGVANRDLTPDLVLALGRAAGLVLAPDGGRIVIGRDTRLSGPMLEGALVAGLCSAGARVLRAGVVPTPAVAFLTVELEAAAGGVLSASHNPVPDNGIKFFSAEGFKLATELEERIEETLASSAEKLPIGGAIGLVEELVEGRDRYERHVLDSVEGGLEGIKVVLDCAHGSASGIAPHIFAAAGAEVVAIHDLPDGARINVDCGSTSLDEVAERVVAEGAQLGLAFDGDADRVLAVDECGEVVDGDTIIGMTALQLHEQGALKNEVVVTTVMSNLGFRRALEACGIELIQVPVGDRFVVEQMQSSGAIVGGEQSGHVIIGADTTTGDGLLTGLHVARLVALTGRRLSQLARFYEPFPQVLINVEVVAKDKLESAGDLWDEVDEVERRLGEDGRVLLRASGTEPLVRVMVEAADEDMARAAAERLADATRRCLG